LAISLIRRLLSAAGQKANRTSLHCLFLPSVNELYAVAI